MPFCPKCRYEYLEGTGECPDCQCDLVDELSSQDLPKSTVEPNLIPLQSLPGLIYAEMVAEALKKAGIPSLIKSDVLTSGYGARGATTAGAECRIWVEKKHKKRAESILHTMMDHI